MKKVQQGAFVGLPVSGMFLKSDRCVVCGGSSCRTNSTWKAYQQTSSTLINKSLSSLPTTAKTKTMVRYQQNANCYQSLCIRLVLFCTQNVNSSFSIVTLSRWSDKDIHFWNKYCNIIHFLTLKICECILMVYKCIRNATILYNISIWFFSDLDVRWQIGIPLSYNSQYNKSLAVNR